MGASEEEHRHAAALMEYQTIRGGRVVLQNITKPTITEWGSPLEALAAVFEMEKTVNKCLVDLEALATTKGDFRLASFIQEKFLRKQVLDLKMIGDFLTKIKRVGTGLGVHMLDKDLARNYMAEEYVKNISHIERENLANIFIE